MEQLKFKDIINLYYKLGEQYGLDVVLEMPVYLGDDDELNGIHCGWFCDMLDTKNKEDEYFIELINADYGNFPLKDKGILIS